MHPETGWLQTTWRLTLRTALSRALHRDVPEGSEARILAGVDGRQLIRVEAELRRVGDPRPVGLVSHLVGSADTSAGPEAIAACLFTMAAHRNGFTREQAVRALGRHPSRLAIAAATIRCSDWVYQVGDTAQSLVLSWARHPAFRELLFQSLDVLAALKARDRVMATFWPKYLEPVLLAPENEGLRWQAAQQGSTPGRRLAHALIARADPHRRDELNLLALSDPDPSVARAGLANALTTADPKTHLSLLDGALRHRSATVRAEALRALGGEAGDAARARLEAALFDIARAPRSAAAFLLRHVHGLDARSRWRTSLDAMSRRASVALVALAEVAEPEDVPRLLAWRDSPNGRIRIAVLRGLLRTKTPHVGEEVRAALLDPSPRVLRDALNLAANGATLLDSTLLEQAYESAASSECRKVLIRGLRHLSLWDALARLLRWCRQPPDDLRDVLSEALIGWLGRSTAGHAKLSHGVRDAILEGLPEASRAFPDLAWREIHFALRAAAP